MPFTGRVFFGKINFQADTGLRLFLSAGRVRQSCLSASELERLGDIIKQFDIDDNAEFTIEANPGTLDRKDKCNQKDGCEQSESRTSEHS